MGSKNKGHQYILVYHIEYYINPNRIILVEFKRKPLFHYYLEETICQLMIKYHMTKLIKTSMTLYHSGYTIYVTCKPQSFHVQFDYNVKNDDCFIEWLTYLYQNPNVIITNENNESFINNNTWQIAKYLGHII